MLRRLAVSATASVAMLVVTAPGASALAAFPLPLVQEEARDRLTVTTSRTGNPQADGTYELTCGPAGGTHPAARAACARLVELGGGGRDPFAPVGQDRMCSQQYGGPAKARITGTWHGRPVNTSFDRSNGCEIGRWRAMEPILPTPRT
jgi:hypothetical protein